MLFNSAPSQRHPRYKRCAATLNQLVPRLGGPTHWASFWLWWRRSRSWSMSGQKDKLWACVCGSNRGYDSAGPCRSAILLVSYLGQGFTFREDFMRRYIHGVALFGAGMIAGLFLLGQSQAQDDRLTGIRINHVGIWAKDWDETLNFYTK